jgi:hypothetical protein
MSLILVTVAVLATFVAFMSVISLVALAVTSHLSRRHPAPIDPARADDEDQTLRLSRSSQASSAA